MAAVTTAATTTVTNPRSIRSATARSASKLVKFNPEFSGKPDEDAEAHLLPFR